MISMPFLQVQLNVCEPCFACKIRLSLRILIGSSGWGKAPIFPQSPLKFLALLLSGIKLFIPPMGCNPWYWWSSFLGILKRLCGLSVWLFLWQGGWSAFFFHNMRHISPRSPAKGHRHFDKLVFLSPSTWQVLLCVLL